MPSLAGLLEFDPAPEDWKNELKHLKLSSDALYLLWNGLSPDTRSSYRTAKRSYEYYCQRIGVKAWPAQERTLAEWVTGRCFGKKMHLQDRVKADTIASMLSALRLVHVDMGYSLALFESILLKRILQGVKRIQLDPKTKQAEPISKETLTKVVDSCDNSLFDLHFSTASIVAFAGMLQSGEFTYSKDDLKNKRTFVNTKLTRSDITFTDSNEYAILRLKRSKTDFDHKGVEIVLAATHDKLCPVTALRKLFQEDNQPPDAPLFRFNNKPFDYNTLVGTLRERLQQIGDP